jgi:hypothetical protein
VETTATTDPAPTDTPTDPVEDLPADEQVSPGTRLRIKILTNVFYAITGTLLGVAAIIGYTSLHGPGLNHQLLISPAGLRWALPILVAAAAIVFAAGACRKLPADDEYADDGVYSEVVDPILGDAVAEIVYTARDWTADDRALAREIFEEWSGEPGVTDAQRRIWAALREAEQLPDAPAVRTSQLIPYLSEMVEIGCSGVDYVILAVYARDHGLITARYFDLLTRWWEAAGLPLPEPSARVASAAPDSDEVHYPTPVLPGDLADHTRTIDAAPALEG